MKEELESLKLKSLIMKDNLKKFMQEQEKLINEHTQQIDAILCLLKNEGTPFPINNLLALHKQYIDCPSNLAGYEAENLYKRLLFIRNIL